jgi:hypothetical protein
MVGMRIWVVMMSVVLVPMIIMRMPVVVGMGVAVRVCIAMRAGRFVGEH